MKELDFGMYSDNNLKCSCCKRTDVERAKLKIKKKLVLCANCKGAWYCGRDCPKRRFGKRGPLQDLWKDGRCDHEVGVIFIGLSDTSGYDLVCPGGIPVPSIWHKHKAN